ncbi:pumilio homolog 12 [Arachis hypogaea]|nr:pumilio homolog 12 isoform X1 [Arachis hypogaea]
MVSNNSSQPNDWCWVNTNLALEDLDSAMERLSLSIVSQENSAAANSVDPHEYTLTHSTLEEASSEHGNRNVMNNYNNGAIVQGALLTSSHDYNGFTSTEQETHDVEESVAQRLRGIRGHMVTLAMDQWGCRFLQAIIDNGIPQEIDMILDEVEDHTHELMTHHFGNYLIEKFFTSGKLTFYQFQRILLCVVMDVQQLKHTCMNDHGTRVAQKMLTSLRDPVHIAYTIRRLMYITVPLLKNANGGYVIQQCVRVFTESCQKVIFDEIARNCVDVATDKNGCSVIQKCMAHSAGVPILLLVKSIIINSEILSADPFGNYVVQYIIKRNILEPPVTKMIILHLRGHYAELSMNRHASHVIEVLFRHSEPTDVDIIIMELVNSPDFVSVLRHPYGNYVAQRALQFSTGVTNRTLVHRILSNYAYLHAHPYGKRVLTYIKGIRRGG